MIAKKALIIVTLAFFCDGQSIKRKVCVSFFPVQKTKGKQGRKTTAGEWKKKRQKLTG